MNRPVITALCVIAFGCRPELSEAPIMPGPPVPVPVPAGQNAGEPFLAATADGGVLLSWVEATSDSTHALRFVRLQHGRWSAPRTVAGGSGWFVNWADFPSIVELPDGGLAAHWLQRSGPGTYAYDLYVTRSADGGESWSLPVRPHADGTATEHGFATLFPHQGGLGVVWLDGRQFAAGGGGTAGQGDHGTGPMALRFAVLEGAGPAPELELDGRTCDCCQTAVAVTPTGPVVFYRDRTDAEVRDISVTRLVRGSWTSPVPVHKDDWRIDACPVNGPAASAQDEELAVAWFTAARDTPRVLVAFADSGTAFRAPARADGGDPVGRVALAPAGRGAVWVSWLENHGPGAEIRLRRVSAAEGPGPMVTIAAVSAGRATGFPRLLRQGGQLWVAWTGGGEDGGIRLVSLDLVEPGR